MTTDRKAEGAIPLPGLSWLCDNCGATFAVYPPSRPGDAEPCTECQEQGVTHVVEDDDG